MFCRQLLNEDTACASYLFGCRSRGRFAVVDPHVDLVDEYVALAEAHGSPIIAVFETHVQADHVSGLPELVARTGGDEPWFVLTGDALLVGDAGRPDLHAGDERSVEDMARLLYRSLTVRLL